MTKPALKVTGAYGVVRLNGRGLSGTVFSKIDVVGTKQVRTSLLGFVFVGGEAIIETARGIL